MLDLDFGIEDRQRALELVPQVASVQKVVHEDGSSRKSHVGESIVNAGGGTFALGISMSTSMAPSKKTGWQVDSHGIANSFTRISVNQVRVCLSQPHRMSSTRHVPT